ncbi:MAG: hypothetical protein JO266_18880 [Acidobacteria bacterium]|nr:hypothetical protein [Acidobacteriota bacterium]
MDGPRAPSRRRWWRLVGIFVGALAALWAISLPVISRWGFGSEKVARDLAEATAGKVRFRSFRNVYFPHPGCVAEGVIIQRQPGEDPPLISIRRLTLIGSVLGIYKNHVSLIQAEGLEVTPAGRGWPKSTNKSAIIIERLVANDALLRVLHDDHKHALNFKVHQFTLEQIGGDGPMPFRVELSNPLPPGEIAASGKLGPWQSEARENIPIAGSYFLRRADLSAIGGIGGLLWSNGKFQGMIRQLHVEGTTETPEFEVIRTHHRFPLKTKFDAEVNAINADVILRRIEATLGKTNLVAQGTVVPDQQHRRTATLDFLAHDGRIQDILFPFVGGARSPLTGVSNCRGRVVLPAGGEPFVRKVSLDADFGIAEARLTNPETQGKLNQASERARGNPDADSSQNVLSELSGHVTLKKGVASFSQLSFQVPGARASMQGTFNVINQRINLRGVLELDAKISDTTSGFKGFVLKAISPFVTKNKPRQPLPVSVTGTYDHPDYSVSLSKGAPHRHGM